MAKWRVEITDTFPACPGKLIKHGFWSKREAQIWARREAEAAGELFTDGRSNISVAVIRETEIIRT